jgi:hypothetical protein
MARPAGGGASPEESPVRACVLEIGTRETSEREGSGPLIVSVWAGPGELVSVFAFFRFVFLVFFIYFYFLFFVFLFL